MKTKNLVVLIVVILILLYIIKTKNWISTYIFNNYKIVNITKSNSKINKKLKNFEKRLTHWYPLGDDSFKIYDGSDYFSFFERLGSPTFALAMKGEKIVGLGSGVLRSIPLKLGHTDRHKVWYVCDLKVDPKYRGKGLTIKMSLKNLDKLKTTKKIYAVSMNTLGEQNKILKLVKQIPFVKMKKANKLLIYSLDYDEMIRAQLIVMKHRGPVNYRDV